MANDTPAKLETAAGPPNLRAVNASRPGTGEIPVAGAGGRGFSARLNGAALFDLIQLECMSHAQKVVRVQSGARMATLFIRDGRLVHASAGRLVGEPAVAEVLGWGEGVFERIEAPWPAAESIAGSLEHVLLGAAQALDEARTPNVVSLPVRPPPPPSPLPARAPAMSKPAPPAPAPAAPDELWVRLSPGGELLEHRGRGSEELADAVAYASQMMDLVGQLLGLDRAASVELCFERGKCLIQRDDSGAIVATKPAR